MPRVIKRTPEWLIAPSAGYNAFNFKPAKQTGNKTTSTTAQLRTIARGRGTEVFIAAGNELRWVDLTALKNAQAERDDANRRPLSGLQQSNSNDFASYRILKVPGSGTITQLHVSPEKEYLAILRSHQIYIVVLPDARHLQESDLGPYKLKSFHLGPTIHCLEESPVVSAVWHPLGEQSRCLVTITEDAVVRLWELNKDDRSSFEQPSIAIDLKKLANAVTADQDVSATKFGSSKGFTPDAAELEPAAICFGGRGQEGENPWHAMTLWMATKGGDVYALSPLIPRRFEAPAGFLESLDALVNMKRLEAEEDSTQVISADAQIEFLTSLQEQEPILAQGASEFEARYVYSRPVRPGPAPKLQGPFEIDPEVEEDFEFADIYVTPFELTDDLDFEADQTVPGLPSLVCLLTTDSRTLIVADLDGIDGMWIPARGTPFSTPRSHAIIMPDAYHTLTLFETIDLRDQEFSSTSIPIITPDAVSPHAFFVTNSHGVHYISAARWIATLQNELAELEGAENPNAMRLNILLDGASSLVEHPVAFKSKTFGDAGTAACIVYLDSRGSRSGIGYFLLTMQSGQPWAAQLDISDSELSDIGVESEYLLEDPDVYSTLSTNDQKQLIVAEPREVYRPDPVFERPSRFPTFIREVNSDRRTAQLMREEVELSSPALLETMIRTHQEIQREYRDMNTAAVALFTQCEKLRNNLKDQIKRARELKDVTESLTNDNDEDDNGNGLCGGEIVGARLTAARTRQQELAERVEKLKSSLSGVSTRELSDKEKAFATEICDLDAKLVTGEVKDDSPTAKASNLMERYLKVTKMSAELAAIAKESGTEGGDSGENKENRRRSILGAGSARVPEGFRKQRVQGILDLLEREKVLVERAVEKFERLRVD